MSLSNLRHKNIKKKLEAVVQGHKRGTENATVAGLISTRRKKYLIVSFRRSGNEANFKNVEFSSQSAILQECRRAFLQCNFNMHFSAV